MRFHPVTAIRHGSLFEFRRQGQVLELHLNSRALVRMRREPGFSAWKAVHRMREELAVLASRITRGQLAGVRVITGTSLIGEAGAVLGFETYPLPRNLANLLKQYFMVGLDAIYHPRGLRTRSMRRWPVETTMTVDALLRRYGEKSDRSTLAR